MLFRTLTRPVVWKGKGLHTGEESCVEVSSSRRPGVFFIHGDREVPLSSLEADGAGRGTTVIFEDGRRIMTVEHLLGALSGLGIWHAVIRVEGKEIPALDGSGRIFTEDLDKAAVGAKDGGLLPFIITNSVMVENPANGAFVAAFPALEPKFTSVINYEDMNPPTQSAEYRYDPSVFPEVIAPARTFVLEREIEGILSRGLARGGSLENALVFGRQGPIGPLRFPDEAPRHKILDLLGDLALLGRPVLGHLFSYKGGHALNIRLVGRLRRISAIN
ncbi:MAG TPA: UDP-3-0-acyl N-acetylglucosamine deacetylase [Synergistaceae bacterium]|nr:MAG: UDP-3-0-acyl N-acetylglucosamine deacetylase [Synergistales bacterium 54_9]HAA48045.1 UDP-3-0-acyl N-acetylglucosamine deacetylase [Synergistaceae bacterium]